MYDDNSSKPNYFFVIFNQQKYNRLYINKKEALKPLLI